MYVYIYILSAIINITLHIIIYPYNTYHQVSIICCIDSTVTVITIMTAFDDNYPYNNYRYRNSHLCWTRTIITDGYENFRYVIKYRIDVFAAMFDCDWRLIIWYSIILYYTIVDTDDDLRLIRRIQRDIKGESNSSCRHYYHRSAILWLLQRYNSEYLIILRVVSLCELA